jgi:hypothetical protein
MKNMILIAILTLIPKLAAASETNFIYCGFTEPFFSLTVDLEKKTVTRVEPDWEDAGETVSTVIAEGVKLESNFSDPLLPKYVVKDSTGSVILDLTLNMKGSDHMSDIIFPLEAKHMDMWGGCETDQISSYNPYE